MTVVLPVLASSGALAMCHSQVVNMAFTSSNRIELDITAVVVGWIAISTGCRCQCHAMQTHCSSQHALS